MPVEAMSHLVISIAAAVVKWNQWKKTACRTALVHSLFFH